VIDDPLDHLALGESELDDDVADAALDAGAFRWRDESGDGKRPG
jgi:hypothetical protein